MTVAPGRYVSRAKNYSGELMFRGKAHSDCDQRQAFCVERHAPRCEPLMSHGDNADSNISNDQLFQRRAAMRGSMGLIAYYCSSAQERTIPLRVGRGVADGESPVKIAQIAPLVALL